jgi:glycosidase
VARVVYQIFVAAFGSLDAVAAHLPHVQALGADAVYLTPVFTAPSQHKYDTTDFDHVDEGFGGAAAFARLVDGCRARGLGLILDGVFNHVGAAHPWTREHPGWFSGSDWRGFPSLRELDTTQAEVRRVLCDVVAGWTRRGASGWRLDCMNDLGPRFAEELAVAARDAGAVDGIIGEIMAYPAGWVRPGGALTGVMNYWLRMVALALGAASSPAAQLQASLDRLAAEMEPQILAHSWSLIGSHDTTRVATALGSEAAVDAAQALMFAYPGIPMIYYGDELGQLGGPDPDCRRPLPPKSEWHAGRWERTRLLCRLRREHPALTSGRYVPLPQPGTDVIAFARVPDKRSDTLIFVANAGPRATATTLFVPLNFAFDALPLVDLLGGVPAAVMHEGTLRLTLPPHGAVLLAPRDDLPGGYRFFKPSLVLDSAA